MGPAQHRVPRPGEVAVKYQVYVSPNLLVATMCLFVAALFVSAATPFSAAAKISNLTWQDVEIVDQPVSEVPSPAGAAMVFASEAWHVVYARGDQIYHRVRADAGWLAPEPLSGAFAPVRDPHIAAAGDQLLVVWEDERFGHPEVWARRYDGSLWTPDTCLTCDTALSRAPVVAPIVAGVTMTADGFLVAWEEGSSPLRRVQGRLFLDGGWQPIEDISLSPAEAWEPTASNGSTVGSEVTWTDTRHGASEIYHRIWVEQLGGWQPEGRVTQDGVGSRRPSIHTELICADLCVNHWTVAFEQEVAGTAECFLGDGYLWGEEMPAVAMALSPHDGVASIRPSTAGLALASGPWPISRVPVAFVAWTDVPLAGPRRHELALFVEPVETDTLTEAGLSLALVATVCPDSLAQVLVMWTEMRDGVPTLLARHGTFPPYWPVGVGDRLGVGVHFSAYPNPSRGVVTLLVQGALPQGSIRIVDVAGRLIRRLVVTGSQVLPWDLRDAHGRRVPPGVYTAILESGAMRERRSLVVLP